MAKNLVIVESPAKARTIERYLGPGYKVLASYGHVRDLPENPGKGKLGVDIEHDFKPDYVISEDRKKQVATIAKEAKSAETVYLATDLDREGEAIAWHVAEAANVSPAKARRVTFSEITPDAIRDAFAHPRDIDQNLVDAQQTRRILDRLVGYTLSPLLWRKVHAGLSAGRVQSVAVRLVVEREREINAFSAREYWTIEALLATDDGAELSRRAGAYRWRAGRHGCRQRQRQEVRGHRRRRDGRKARRGAAQDAAARHRDLQAQLKRRPSPPFTTSTLQQEASRKLSFNPKRTMRVAQDLYEGIDTPEGRVGLITYMRTDSTADGPGRRCAKRAKSSRRASGCATSWPRAASTQRRARAPRRPTRRSARLPSRATPIRWTRRSHRSSCACTDLIWQRALASQMADKELETTTVDLSADPYELRASATRTVFDGFSAVYTEGLDDSAEEAERQLPPTLAQGDKTDVRETTPDAAFHPAAAALHGGLADQGARGARYRPAVDLRGHDLHDHRSRLRHGRRASAASGARRRCGHGPARRALRRLR